MEHSCNGVVLIGERILRYWTESGRSDILARLLSTLGEFAGRETSSDLPRLLYELVWIVLHAKLTKQEIVGLFKEANLARYPKACDLLTDLLWVIGNEVEVSERGHGGHTSREWRHLCALVKAIADEEIVSLLNLKSLLEFDLLHDADLAPEPQVQAKRMIRINTKTLYTQTKYNLLREESEGFSKVLCLLHTGVTKSQLEATKTDLMALIGYFDLDANRVLDLVLDAYEMHPRNDCFAQLLDIFKRESLPHIIGFKFQFYKRELPTEERLTTPRSLYRLAAILLNKRLLDLDDILPHLAPSREAILKASLEHEKEIIKKARSFGQVSLAAKKDTVQPDGDDEVVLAMERKKEAEHYQVYGVIVGLLEIGARERAFEMITWFQKRGVNPLTYTPLTRELCAVVNVMIENVYDLLSYRTLRLVSGMDDALEDTDITAQSSSINGYIRRVATLEDCVTEVFPIVEMIGPQLYCDQFLFVKLLRIAGKLADEQTKKMTTSDTTIDNDLAGKVKSLLVNTFLPAMSLQECNPSTSFLIWDLLKCLPCEERYRMYLRWFEAYDKHPQLRLKEAEVVQSTRGVMRRLTADRAKLSARSLTHVAHSNPLIVFRTMLRQIQSYDNLIQPVVDSFKFVTPLGMDVLSFVLVSELARPQKSMKADGTHVSLWLSSLANFSGSFYRKYPNVELSGLLQYLIQRLLSWASVDLIVLSELLTKMGSCLSLEDISESQLEAQAGGPHLWFEPTDPKFQNRRAIPKLRDALIKRNIALPLCILICQMRSRIEYHENQELPHLKLLGRIFDMCQLTFSQLLQFLGGVVDPIVYRKMLPSVTTLVCDYNVQPELAMALCRPAMRSDDPLLRTAPRSVHATGGSSTTNDKAPINEEILNGASSDEQRWFMYNQDFLDDVRQALNVHNNPDYKSGDPFTGLTPEVYATFWGLKLYDIHVPFQQYESEILRLRNSVTSGANASLGASERKKLKEKMTQMIDVLTTEQKDQVAHRKRVYERLENMKGKFFTDEPNDRKTALDELLQKCVIPRSLMSPEDALFAAKFMERLHTLSTPQMSTLQYIHKVNIKVSAIVLCATEREASNFGFFMKETLGFVLRWYQNGATYDDEAIHGKIGMSLDLNDDNKFLAHRQFKTAYAHWHQQLELVYTTALSSGEYMQIRNSLVVLTKLIDVFPAGRGTADVILGIVETLTNEEREDIKIMAKRYFALLTKRKISLIDDRLLRTRIVPSKSTIAVASGNEKRIILESVVESKKKDDDVGVRKSDDKRESSIKTASNFVESQEVESGEIVLGKSNSSSESSVAVSSRLKQRDTRGNDRSRSNISARINSTDDAHDRSTRLERQEPEDRPNRPTEYSRLSEERRGQHDHRDSLPAIGGHSGSMDSRTNELNERGRSAPRGIRENSTGARRSRSGERMHDPENTNDNLRTSREREVEIGQFHRTERGDVDRRSRDITLLHNDRNRSQESKTRARDVMSAREESEPIDLYRKSETFKPSPVRIDETQNVALSPKPDRECEPGTMNRGVRIERENEYSALEAGHRSARQSEQMEAALRRQLTAGKEAKAKEQQQSGERMWPVARDRTRPPLPATTTAATTDIVLPSDPETTKKIVSLVSSSRKRERERELVDKSEIPTANALDGKRRRDGGSSKGVGGGGDSKYGQDEKRKRRNKGGVGDGNKGNQLQRDHMRGRQQDRNGRNNGNIDRRGSQDDRINVGNNAGRRRDRNENRGGRR
ncbi:KEKE-like motif-containing transcription regulator (Rlr1)/suppressor of sin4 [Plasmopara halstedii]|uniref:THO complex subunit 2 n=1 Tax=Plasmopara halstedii TaxID=4781 RepID=A0A0P1ABL3_PLAHL|nr:KEKE-like motif-containing transcription regulator (Rlr1)/suppressor of sin4 [Plasmopara halstedii]CEG37686.1 KEKE-like motif-containing transcription regulator (Rlr1)/suppressor of sin4 [Plasmopara halstedii]|eukprot:XP_024574055.1 KEKE-like motif-containing transcription regulator (Rlr1)/suppressor of sin4 [Plasmopara halstedii]